VFNRAAAWKPRSSLEWTDYVALGFHHHRIGLSGSGVYTPFQKCDLTGSVSNEGKTSCAQATWNAALVLKQKFPMGTKWRTFY